MQQYLTAWDLVLTPVYLLILSAFARRYRDKHYPKSHPLRSYFLPGLYLKFGGAIFIGLIYQYYYGGGDTYNFFLHSKTLNTALDDSFEYWIKLLMVADVNSEPYLYRYTSQMEWYTDPSSYMVVRIGAVFGLLNNTSYMPISLLFAFFSYTGVWAMFKTFSRIYPHIHKPLAFAFLYVPSAVVWGSGMFKDTVCLFSLGWMTYCTFRIFVDRDFSLKNFLLLAISFYLIAIIKVYILLAYIPALGLWILMTYSKRITTASLRWVTILGSSAVLIAAFFFISQIFAKELKSYSLERIQETAEITRDWIIYSSGDEGSAYDLGKIDGSVSGLFAKFPAAVVVTLYRPFLWEVNKPIMALSALEALLFLLATVYIIFNIGLGRFIKKIFSDPNLTFFFVFAIIFAFAVGISTGNFGTLSRYKIPCMPFFAALLIVLFYERKMVKKPVAAI